MKKLFPLIILALLALACDKVNTGGDKTLKSISFAKESVSLEVGESEVFTIKTKPVNADAPKLVYESTAPGVAKVNGNKIVAIGEGNAVITASVKGNPAISCQCNVTVKPYIDAVKVTSLSLEKNYLELSDLGPGGEADEALVTITLAPADAGWKDLLIYAEDEDINLDPMDGDPLYFRVSVTPNPTHETTDVRTKKVIVKAKRSNGEISKTLQVKICGHVSGFQLPQLNTTDKEDYHFDNNTLRLVSGETYSLDVNCTTTGTLKTGATPFIAKVDGDGLTATPAANSCLLKVPQDGTVTGKSKPLHLRISNGLTDESDVSIPVYTYKKPTSVSCDLHVAGNTLKTGVNYILSVTTQPEESLCHIYLSSTPSSVSDLDIVNNNNNISSIRFKAAKSTQSTESFSPKSKLLTPNPVTFQINDYTDADIKCGDYVYYKSNESFTFSWSDGGLRALGSDFTRYASTSTPPVTDKGTLIGIVYETFTSMPAEMQGATSIKMAGLGGKFVAVVSAKDAAVGDANGKYWWTSAAFDLESAWGLNTNTYPVPKKGEIHTWKVNKGIDAYNTKTSATDKKIKAYYSVTAFGDKNKDGNMYVRVGSTTNAGSSGWLLPTDSDAKDILEVLSIIQHSLSAAGAIDSFSASAKAQKFKGPYWTANYEDNTRALAFGAKENDPTGTIQNEPFPWPRQSNTECVTRPILFL